MFLGQFMAGLAMVVLLVFAELANHVSLIPEFVHALLVEGDVAVGTVYDGALIQFAFVAVVQSVDYLNSTLFLLNVAFLVLGVRVGVAGVLG